jgi:hypothetical protein
MSTQGWKANRRYDAPTPERQQAPWLPTADCQHDPLRRAPEKIEPAARALRQVVDSVGVDTEGGQAPG